MKTIREILKSPTPCDSMSNYIGDVPSDEWLVVLTQNRDSDCMTRTNWEEAKKLLSGCNEEDVEVFRFGHWACGWWQAMCARKGSAAEAIGKIIETKLACYPILNDDTFSELELEEAELVWKNCYNSKERLEYMRNHWEQFSFHSFADLLGCVRGKFFAGNASELLS